MPFVASMTPLTGLTATSGTWTLPSGWQPGDVALFWYYHRSNINTFTEPAGVTQKHDHTTATSSDGRLFIGYRTLESGDSTFVWTATNTDPSIPQVWGCDVFRGIDNVGDPFGADSGTPTLHTNTVSPNPPAVTPPQDDAIVWTIFVKNSNLTATPPTAPTNYTLANYGSTVNNASGGTAYRVLTGGGGVSEDPGAWTLSSQVGTDNFTWTGALSEGSTTIIGSSVFGVTGTVKKPRAVLFSLDNAVNELDEAGKLKICGDLEVTGDVTVSGGGVGDSTTTAVEASKPAAAADGNLFFPSNGFYLWRDTGSVWQPWGPIFPMTPPVDGDFAWINQGGASVDTTNGGIYLVAPAVAGANLRIRKKAAPSTPYTITAYFLTGGLLGLTAGPIGGLLFRNNAAGTLHTFMLNAGNGGTAPTLFSAKYSSPTLFSATYTSSNWFTSSPGVWLRIADNGTNRICSVSGDGQHWQTFHSVGRTDFLTADEVGFFAYANNGTYDAAITLLSWKQA